MHLLSHGIPSTSSVIKTFQNSLPFSSTKVCLLFLVRHLALTFFHYPHHIVFPQSPVETSLCSKNKQMSRFSNIFPKGITRLVLKFSDRKYTFDIDYWVWYTVCLVLAESIAIDDHSLHIWFTNFNESITMFPDKINQIPLCIGLFPVSTAQSTSSLLSEVIFTRP